MLTETNNTQNVLVASPAQLQVSCMPCSGSYKSKKDSSSESTGALLIALPTTATVQELKASLARELGVPMECVQVFPSETPRTTENEEREGRQETEARQDDDSANQTVAALANSMLLVNTTEEGKVEEQHEPLAVADPLDSSSNGSQKLSFSYCVTEYTESRFGCPCLLCCAGLCCCCAACAAA